MSKSPSPTTTTMNQPRSAAILLFLTLLDTTWRAFVPTIGGTILGVVLDNTFHTPPLYTTILIIAGFAISILLIILQLRRVRKS